MGVFLPFTLRHPHTQRHISLDTQCTLQLPLALPTGLILTFVPSHSTPLHPLHIPHLHPASLQCQCPLHWQHLQKKQCHSTSCDSVGNLKWSTLLRQIQSKLMRSRWCVYDVSAVRYPAILHTCTSWCTTLRSGHSAKYQVENHSTEQLQRQSECTHTHIHMAYSCTPFHSTKCPYYTPYSTPTQHHRSHSMCGHSTFAHRGVVLLRVSYKKCAPSLIQHAHACRKPYLPLSSSLTASAIYGTSSLLTMNPGVSFGK